MEIGTDDRILELIEAGVMAGAYQALAREMPDAERGLLKMAAKWSARAATLAAEISSDAGLEAQASERTSTRATR